MKETLAAGVNAPVAATRLLAPNAWVSDTTPGLTSAPEGAGAFGRIDARLLRTGRRQQMTRQIERVCNHSGDYRACDDRRNQRRILSLVDDPVRKTEQRRDGSEGQPGRHQEGRVHRLLVRCRE